jgi:hypothetical protein
MNFFHEMLKHLEIQKTQGEFKEETRDPYSNQICKERLSFAGS